MMLLLVSTSIPTVMVWGRIMGSPIIQVAATGLTGHQTGTVLLLYSSIIMIVSRFWSSVLCVRVFVQRNLVHEIHHMGIYIHNDNFSHSNFVQRGCVAK
jgi:hypothetical protein